MRAVRINPRPRHLISLTLLALSAALTAFADGPSTQPSSQSTSDPVAAVTEPTAPLLKVQLWSVLVVDDTNGQVNSDGLVHSCLPEFTGDKRFDESTAPPPVINNGRNRRWIVVNGRVVPELDIPAAGNGGVATPTTAPSPMTVIRFDGSYDGKFDVALKIAGSTLYAQWPPAEIRSDELLWRDLTIAATSPTTPTTAPADSVFTTLRSADFPYLSIKPKEIPAVTEKFLTVDQAIAITAPLRTKVNPDGTLDVTNTGRGTARGLCFYRGGQRVAMIGDLELPTTQQSSTQPTTRATTRPESTVVEADWMSVALQAGINPTDAKIIGDAVGRYATDEDRLTAVYRMDDVSAAKLYPLEIVPTPKSVDRFVLVVLRNADPSAKTVIDALIQKLGDDDWNVREAAMHTLAGYGPAAVNKLQGATSDKDAEISWRATRLIQMAKKQ